MVEVVCSHPGELIESNCSDERDVYFSHQTTYRPNLNKDPAEDAVLDGLVI